MQISLRSHLAAGSAALIGASAIALTPVIAQPVALPALPATMAADVSLAALDFSLVLAGAGQALGATVADATDDIGAIVAQVLSYQDDIATFASTVIGGLTQAATGAFSGDASPIPAIINSVVGLVPDLIANGPAVAFANLQAGITAAINAPIAVITGAVNAVITVVTQAVNGLAAGLGQLGGLAGAYTAVVADVLGGVVSDAGSAIAAGQLGTGAVAGIVIDGLLGPTGVAGTVEQLTLGTGVVTTIPTLVNSGGFTPVAQGAVFVPSVRSAVFAGVEAFGQGVTAGLGQAFGGGGQGGAQARSAASARSAAAVAAPAAEAAPAGESAASGDSTPAEKPVKQRTARKAAK
jgi:hypothetical protein